MNEVAIVNLTPYSRGALFYAALPRFLRFLFPRLRGRYEAEREQRINDMAKIIASISGFDSVEDGA